MIALLVFTDGRDDLLRQTLTSFSIHTEQHDMITHRILVDDSGLPSDRLEDIKNRFDLYVQPETKAGFCGVIQKAWSLVPPNVDFIFHLEDDFLFNRSVDLLELVETLQDNPYLAQIVLKRQAWSTEEKKAGGVVEMWPSQYTQKNYKDRYWLEHRLFWSTNPSLYWADFCREGWPDGPRCEEAFTNKLITRNPTLKFAFWGEKKDAPWVEHVGWVRAGENY